MFYHSKTTSLVLLLYVQDYLSKDFSLDQINKATEMLTEGYETCVVQAPNSATDITVEYLTGIGRIRFSLAFAVDLLKDLADSKSIDSDTERFMKAVKDTIGDGRLTLNEDSAEGFLLQSLVRWNGYSCLLKLAMSEEPLLRSIVPSRIIEEVKSTSPCVQHNEISFYSRMKSSLIHL